MAQRVVAARKIPIAVLVAGIIGLILLVAAAVYLTRPAHNKSSEPPASQDAKAYVSELRLSDVTMKASENFMKQQVVEVEGKITNAGDRALKSVDVYCLFYGIDGREIHRERVAILQSKAAPLKPNETRPFRLPFDTLPDGWNQAMPRMVIAGITFAQ
jgi:hypothetical protein